MADLIVITGPPGAGKSSVGRALSARYPLSAFVVGDDVFAFLDRGYREPWTPDAHAQNDVVIQAAAAAAGRFAAGGYTVVYDGVVGPWFLDAFLDASGLPELHYVLLLPPEQVCVQRVAGREGHPFTDLDAARHMHRQFAGADLDPRHLLTAEHNAERLAADIQNAVAGGSFRYP